MEKERLMGIIEALIFASERPIREDDIKKILPAVKPKEIREALEDLTEIHEKDSGGMYIAEVAGGYQFRTRAEFSQYIRSLLEIKPKRLSRAAMETLSIVAYRQPVTRQDIERLRGVDSGGVLKLLLDRKLLKIMGKQDIPGKPLIYGTTKEFLETFGLKDLSSLPNLKEMNELFDEGEIEQQTSLLFGDEDTQTE